jgi:magnesium chelatase family protein
VLFLDELPEFHRNILEMLRQPMEDGTINITRSLGRVSYPASFMLIAAMNPCPCGFLTHPKKECHCTIPMIQRYLSRISGPLLDRIDMHLEVPPLNYGELTEKREYESSKEIKKRLLKLAILELNFSGRAYDKILKLGRTIADLGEKDEIDAESIAEAISYRSLDRHLWLST